MKIEQNQNKIFAVGFALIAIVVAWTLFRPAILKLIQKDDNSEEKINEEILKAPVVSSKGLYEKIKDKEKIFLLDMKTSDEFGKFHLAEAVNIPAQDLIADKLNSLGADKTSSVTVMNQGDDAYETAKKTNELVAAGYVNAKYLQGGVSAWQSQGYPLVSGGKSPLDESKIKKISVEELSRVLSDGQSVVQFIDVRNKEDFESGHIPGADNISLSEIERSPDSISLVKKVVVYGNGEDGARYAAIALFDLNFFNVYVLEGDLDAWKAAGGKTEQ
ncbi:MAG: rhodanese-like domain-containing protein [Patescibacteria group bacterium]|nr:rhodanese-like domain-containing protein [Patescibacteria group bacterium]